MIKQIPQTLKIDTELSTFRVAKGGNGPNSLQPMDRQTTYSVYIRQNAVTVLEHG